MHQRSRDSSLNFAVCRRIQEIAANGKFAFMELCLALTIFHEELTMKVFALSTGLMFFKIFHWLAQLRVDNVCLQCASCARNRSGAFRCTTDGLALYFVVKHGAVTLSTWTNSRFRLRLLSDWTPARPAALRSHALARAPGVLVRVQLRTPAGVLLCIEWRTIRVAVVRIRGAHIPGQAASRIFPIFIPLVVYMFVFAVCAGTQFMVLQVSVVAMMIKYLLLMIDHRLQGRWERKSTFLFYLEFSVDLLRLFLFLIFFMVTSLYVSCTSLTVIITTVVSCRPFHAHAGWGSPFHPHIFGVAGADHRAAYSLDFD